MRTAQGLERAMGVVPRSACKAKKVLLGLICLMFEAEHRIGHAARGREGALAGPMLWSPRALAPPFTNQVLYQLS